VDPPDAEHHLVVANYGQVTNLNVSVVGNKAVVGISGARFVRIGPLTCR
jgi:hypothetical protein